MTAMSSLRLSDTSYAVLGLIELMEPATPYELKRAAQVSIFHFWSIPHTQLYTECARLAQGGLLLERQEATGRRRRLYRLSAAGRKALSEWRQNPDTETYGLRDPGLLKLFCGADPTLLAHEQLERHQQRLHTYMRINEQPDLPEGARLALEAGIGHTREYVRFWSRLANSADGAPASRAAAS